MARAAMHLARREGFRYESQAMADGTTTRPTARLLLGRGLGFPWATMLLALGCVVTTLPMFFDRRFYLVLGVGHETADNPHIRWWHTVLTTFVHGGGPPGITAHLAINLAYLLVLGSMFERALGTGRFFALCGACMATEWTAQLAFNRHAHGISGVVWSFVDFAPVLLAHAWRAERWRALRDPAFVAVGLMVVTGLLGLAVKWHALSVLTGIPFVVAWRSVLQENLVRIDRGDAPDRWRGAPRALGVAAPAVLVAFASAMTLAAVLGHL